MTMVRTTCLACDGDGFGPNWKQMTCPVCDGSGKVTRKRRRYCMPCEKWVPERETVCKACGADTDREEL